MRRKVDSLLKVEILKSVSNETQSR